VGLCLGIISIRCLGSLSSVSTFQDELETLPLCPILSISERNLAVMWVCGKSRIQLGIVPPSGSPPLPESPLGEYSIRCLAKRGPHG